MKPTIYLDIYGVILGDGQNLSPGATELIQYAVDHFGVYWLTTFCKGGDASQARQVVAQASDDDLSPYLDKIQPSRWSLAKTEAIDFSQPFLWLDDNCSAIEYMTLRRHNALDSLIKINLHDHPDQLFQALERLKEEYSRLT